MLGNLQYVHAALLCYQVIQNLLEFDHIKNKMVTTVQSNS